MAYCGFKVWRGIKITVLCNRTTWMHESDIVTVLFTLINSKLTYFDIVSRIVLLCIYMCSMDKMKL